MADKHHGSNGVDHKPGWTDGLPHDFKGWGPQTPDPEAPAEESIAPDHDLSWQGEPDEKNHFVWRFDGRRRTYHH